MSVLAAAASAADLLAAREQMAFTLAVHIVLASFGVSFPFITLVANWKGLNDPVAMKLARRWSKVMAVLFAVGAVTGTVLSFEMGLLWPGLMEIYGEVFGIPFAIEGIFFFTEAIFIAIYIYGWDRLSPKAHLLSGVPIVLAGLGGAFAVVAANSWMNEPAGFDMVEGAVTNVDPVAAIFNAAVIYEVPHMILAAYCVGGFTVASVYAWAMLKGRRDRYHRLGFLIPFTVGAIAIPLQMFVGDFAARSVSEDQPIKFAAIEGVGQTSDHVPEVLGGIYDPETGELEYGIAIPDLASILTGFSPDTVITGLDTVPPEDRPPVTIVHLSFDVMVGAGSALMLLALWFGFVWWRRRDLPRTVWFLRAASLGGVLAISATWAGWIVTEVGRQPYVVYGYLRTDEAVTETGGLWWSFGATFLLYVGVVTGAILVLRRMSARWRAADEAALEAAPEDGTPDPDVGAPYGPRVPS